LAGNFWLKAQQLLNATTGFNQKMSRSVLKNVMLLIKDVPKSVKFYSEGLGMSVNHSSEHWAELQSGPVKVCLNRVEG